MSTKPMTPEEKRIRIAELCGYTFIKVRRARTETHLNGRMLGFKAGVDALARTLCVQEYVPDYLNDLNAMHEAEKWLLSQSAINKHDSPFHRYHLALHQICVLPPDTFNQPMQAEHWAITATAEQRAEAFLRIHP